MQAKIVPSQLTPIALMACEIHSGKEAATADRTIVFAASPLAENLLNKTNQ